MIAEDSRKRSGPKPRNRKKERSSWMAEVRYALKARRGNLNLKKTKRFNGNNEDSNWNNKLITGRLGLPSDRMIEVLEERANSSREEYMNGRTAIPGVHEKR